MSKTSVAILFGGKSVEHAISINSAKNIFEYIDKDQFDVTLIGISQEGQWFLKNKVDGNFEEGIALQFSLNPKKKGFINTADGSVITPDMIFPVLHGTDGEDGSIQGMLTSMDLPFVGTGVLGSAISMNKLYSKRLMNAAQIPTSKFIDFTIDQKDQISFDEVRSRLGLPFMTKAANLGSSVGIFKVTDEATFKVAVEEVFQYDHTMLCEAFIDGRELECAVMGNGNAKASEPGEIVVSDEYEFYTYEAKYLDPKAAAIEVPADVAPDIAKKIKELSVKAYLTLHCEDFARVDLFLQKDGEILINEINTIPGFTNSSMFPMMWKHHGISFTELITNLIRLAHDRFKKHKNLVKTYKPS